MTVKRERTRVNWSLTLDFEIFDRFGDDWGRLFEETCNIKKEKLWKVSYINDNKQVCAQKNFYQKIMYCKNYSKTASNLLTGIFHRLTKQKFTNEGNKSTHYPLCNPFIKDKLSAIKVWPTNQAHEWKQEQLELTFGFFVHLNLLLFSFNLEFRKQQRESNRMFDNGSKRLFEVTMLKDNNFVDNKRQQKKKKKNSCTSNPFTDGRWYSLLWR